MKKLLSVVLCLLLIGMAGVSAVSATGESGVLTVSGYAEILAEPDVAYINLGVTTSAAKADTAQANNAKIINAVIAAVKAQGVAAKDVKTGSLYMYPTYDYSKSKATLIGYEVNNTLEITVHNIKKVGDVVDAALKAGATNLSSVSFGIENTDALYLEALAKATKKCMPKAQALAAAAGVKLGKVLQIQEAGSTYTPFYANVNDRGVKEEAVADMAAGVGGTIQAGQVKVSANVSVTFAID